MNKYEKSLMRECLTLAGTDNWYDDVMPESFRVPCVYFPPAHASPGGSAFNSYEARVTIYAKVFAGTRRQAGEIAEAISAGIMEKRQRIPLLNPDGTESGETFKVEPPDTSIIDDGVAQVVLTYSLYKGYYEEEATGVHEIIINQEIKE